MTYRNFLFFFLLIFSFKTSISQPVIQWQKAYGGDSTEIPSDIIQTPDGGYAFIGYTISNNGDVSGKHKNNDVWVVKLNSQGVIAWQKCYGGDSTEIGNGISATKDGGYIICGYTASKDGDVKNNDGGYDAWVAKLNATGDIVWEKTYGGKFSESGQAIMQTPDGGYIMMGYASSPDGDVTTSLGGSDVWVLKLNDTGKIVWQKSCGGPSTDQGQEIIQTKDGGYIVCGYTNNNTPSLNYDILVVKMDNAGNIAWQKSYGGTKTDYGYGICESLYGGYIITGFTQSKDGDMTDLPDSADAFLIYLNDTGKVINQKCFGGAYNDGGYDVLQRGDGNCAVVNYTNSKGGDVSGLHGDLTDIWATAHYPDGSFRWKMAIGGTKPDYGRKIISTSDGGFLIVGGTASTDGDAAGSGFHGGQYDVWLIKLGSTANIAATFTNPDIKVYPTPASDKVYVALPAGFEDADISLWNISGQKMNVNATEKGLSRTIALDNIPEGNYILQVKHGETMSSHKVTLRR